MNVDPKIYFCIPIPAIFSYKYRENMYNNDYESASMILVRNDTKESNIKITWLS